MQILTFSNITRPHYEGGLTIDCRPRGKFLVEVRRTDGTIRRPFGDHLIENTFLNAWRDGQMGGTSIPTGNTDVASAFSWGGGGNASNLHTWLDLFYGAQSCIAIGSGSTAALASDTALETSIRIDSTPYAGGNVITWSQSTGDVVYTIKEEFPAETGSVTYREASIRINSTALTGQSINGLTGASNRIINRVVFPANVILASGEVLILTIAVTVPTLAKTTGKTVTISAQNGMNISGELRCICSQAALVGGTVTGGGVRTRNTAFTMLFGSNKNNSGLLSTKTSFDALGTDPSWGATNQVTAFWSAYTAGQYSRDVVYTWASGTPAADTAFRSILMRPASSGTVGGYQLLLDNEQTKAAVGALSFGLRFAV